MLLITRITAPSQQHYKRGWRLSFLVLAVSVLPLALVYLSARCFRSPNKVVKGLGIAALLLAGYAGYAAYEDMRVDRCLHAPNFLPDKIESSVYPPPRNIFARFHFDGLQENPPVFIWHTTGRQLKANCLQEVCLVESIPREAGTVDIYQKECSLGSVDFDGE